VTSPSPLAAGPVELVRLTANVPADAPMATVQALALSEVSLNGGAIAATGDAGVHLVAYLGEATGDGSYSSADATRISRIAVGMDRGLEAFPRVDPVILADVTGNGAVSATDATRVLQRAVGMTPEEIPPLPGDELAQAVAFTATAMVPDSGGGSASAGPVEAAAARGPAPLDAGADADTDSLIFNAAPDPGATAVADGSGDRLTAFDQDPPGGPPFGVAVPASAGVDPRPEAPGHPPVTDDAAGSDTPRVPMHRPSSAPRSSQGGARGARRIAVLPILGSGPIPKSPAAWTWFVGSARRRARSYNAEAPGRLAGLRADRLPPVR
jgi:hypothetical protein